MNVQSLRYALIPKGIVSCFLAARGWLISEVSSGTGHHKVFIHLTVIGATEPDANFGKSAAAFRQFWNEESQLLAKMSTNGRFVPAEGSSHHIHIDDPELVEYEILQMVDRFR